MINSGLLRARMLTKLTIRNFKLFSHVEIELGNNVVFVGPNNSGKTSALQALALWDAGLKKWIEKRSGKAAPAKRPGVTINRRDLLASPIPQMNLLWLNTHTRDVRRENGKQDTQNVFIEISVEGIHDGQAWDFGLAFDYANPESFYCKPLGTRSGEAPKDVPAGAASVHLAYLPPMSGLSANETRIDPGAINVRLGEGRTAEVLRNLCHQIGEHDESWQRVTAEIYRLFGVKLDKPIYVKERGEIEMSYVDRSSVRLDLSSSGRGLQQTLLLLAHLVLNPGSVLLLDEPDAHLEALRQRQSYQLLSDVAREFHSQIIAASHSEVVLNEAAQRDVVIAFLGKPHRIDNRGAQLRKSLLEIGFDDYYQAEHRGWVLYLEGSTDLAILQTFAHALNHPSKDVLDRPFVIYVGNDSKQARHHFHGLREAKPDLAGVALFDRGDLFQDGEPLVTYMWKRREIENYLCSSDALIAWARDAEFADGKPLFGAAYASDMEKSIAAIAQSLETLGKPSPWSADLKVSDEFLTPLFKAFFRSISLYNLMEKSNFHVLARYVPVEQIDPEVTSVLDLILETSRRAVPVSGPSA